MSISCFFPDCNKKSALFCECAETKTYMCLHHISIHSMTPGNHFPQKLLESSEQPKVKPFEKCGKASCLSLGKVYCHCSSKTFCYSCLDLHLFNNPKIIHNLEQKHQKTIVEDNTLALNIFLHRIQCDSTVINKFKAKNITIKEVLNWNLRTLNSESEKLGLSSTIKYLL